MGAVIWYHPAGADRVRKVDLGDVVTDLQERPEVYSMGAESLSGSARRNVFRNRLSVRIELARFTSASLWRELATLQTHLDLGGTISFARLESAAWAGYTERAYPATTTLMTTRGNTWSYGQSATLTAGDEVCVWGGSPESIREYSTVSSLSANRVTLATGLRHEFTQGPILIRHRDYHPALRRRVDDDEPILTDDRRINYTLDMELVEDVALLASAASWDPGILASTSASSAGRSPRELESGRFSGFQKFGDSASFSSTRSYSSIGATRPR